MENSFSVSDSLDVQRAAKAIRLGADVIVKPFDVQEVTELINAKTKGFKWPPTANAETIVAKDRRRRLA